MDGCCCFGCSEISAMGIDDWDETFGICEVNGTKGDLVLSSGMKVIMSGCRLKDTLQGQCAA